MRKIKTIFLIFITIFLIVPVSAFSDTLKHKLETEMHHDIALYQIPSIALSVSLPNEPHIRTYQAQSLQQEKKYPINSDSLFRVASITKFMVSVYLLKLQQSGIISINDTIGETIKKYGYWAPKKILNQWKNITIKQLMNMTSGIYNYLNYFSNQQFQPIFTNPKKQWNQDYFLEIAANYKPYFKPGCGWHYSDTNYILLGMLIAKIEKLPIDQVLNNRFFRSENIDLKNTYYPSENTQSAIFKHLMPGYFNNKNVTDINASIAGASGAVISNSTDLVKFMRIVFNSNFLDEKQLVQLKSVVDTRTGKPVKNLKQKYHQYGLGIWRTYSKIVGHYWDYEGQTFGYETEIVWIPKSNIVFAITINKLYLKNDPLSSILHRIFKILIQTKNYKVNEKWQSHSTNLN